jgi:predicted acylesterase/phospholipase RssA
MSLVLPRLDFSRLELLAFAGGGNRCWWQGGLITHLRERGCALPPQLVGTSAGAALAASCITEGPEAALRACQRLYAQCERIFEPGDSIKRLKLVFAHQTIYPAWVASFVHGENFHKLKEASSELLVAITRPALALGLAGSVAAGTLAYLVDKKAWHSIHPRLPKWLGLKQEFVALRDCANVQEAQRALSAAAAAPPFMNSVRLNGRWAFDGGYTDNAPIPRQSAAQKAATLVLLTRHYPHRPPMFEWRGRQYWQPSRPVPVSTWDCTRKATVEDAFALGIEDAKRALAQGWLK